jgi:hypothetical protein
MRASTDEPDSLSRLHAIQARITEDIRDLIPAKEIAYSNKQPERGHPKATPLFRCIHALRRLGKRLVEVGKNVVDTLDADR